MKKLIVKNFTVIALSTLACTAFATHDKGAYVEANVGGSYGTFSFFDYSTTTSAIGGNLNAGYQFNRYFAAEVGYTYFGGDLDLSMGNISAKGILPLNEKFNLFAKLGAGYMAPNTGGEGGGLGVATYGIGAAYAITPSLDINTQFQGAWMWQGFGSSTFGLVSGGLTYHF